MTSTASRTPLTQPRCSRPNASGSTSVIGLVPSGRVDQQVGAAVLPQQLPAPPARHQHRAVHVDAGEGDQPAAAGGVQRRHQAALGAQPQPVGRVLDVAADDDPAVVDERGRADRELRVRRVRVPHRLEGGAAQRRPSRSSVTDQPFDVRLAVGGGRLHASDEAGDGDHGGQVRRHGQEVRRDGDRRADDRQHRLQLRR